MTSLRMRVVEAGARAMYEADNAYLDSWESQPEEGVKDWYRKMFAAAFSGALDCLAENAGDWRNEARIAWAEDHYGNEKTISSLLQVLREDR